MAYFTSGSDPSGDIFHDQCGTCIFGHGPCPIALIQVTMNYEQNKDKTGTATEIMEILVDDNGTCNMRRTFKKQLAGVPLDTREYQGTLKF